MSGSTALPTESPAEVPGVSQTAPLAEPLADWPPDLAALERLFGRGRLAHARGLVEGLERLHADAHGASARWQGAGGQHHELVVEGVPGPDGRPHVLARCSCKVGRACNHAAALLLQLHAEAQRQRHGEDLAQWAQALRRRAGDTELRRLPRLREVDAARLLDLMQQDEPPAQSLATTSALPVPAPAAAAPAQFQACLELQTLGRGHGLLGMQAHGRLAARSAPLSVARVRWTYRTADGRRVEAAAPRSLLNNRPPPTLNAGGRQFARDRAAEALARDQLWELGLQPLDAQALQWRSAELGDGHEDLWTLAREDEFGDFWTRQVPALEAQGWRVEALPGFAHRPAIARQGQIRIEPLALPSREGEWLLSLGLELEGETLDLAPLLADLLRRDARWLCRQRLAEIDDPALVTLRAPGGRRILAPAGLIKPVVAAMVDLLSDPRRALDAPLLLNRWDAARLEGLDGRVWQIHGDAGLRRMAERLRAAGQPRAVAPPQGLGLSLRPYQLQGLAWLQYLREQGLAGILADDMGLGKTAQTLAHLLLEKQAGRLDRPALVVLPTSLLFNWQAEAARVAPALRLLLWYGNGRQAAAGQLPQVDLVLTSYTLLWRDAALLQAQPWHLLILDEAQWVKNAASRAARAARALDARYRLALTGTPLENHLGELWAQFDFLMPGFLGDARSFARRWRKPIEEGGESLRAELLAQRVRPFILRRRKDQVAAELPPLSQVQRRVRLQGRQRELYESVRVAADTQVRRVLQRGGFAGSPLTVLDALLRLRQVCCDPLLLKGVELPAGVERAKLEWLDDQLPALIREGRRVLVFSQFTGMLSLLEDRLAALGLRWLSLTGDTPAAERGERVRRFQQGEAALMLISLKAGGVGLNLTAADTVIHLDPWWNPAVQAQASARAHRIGQHRPVFEIQLIVEGSIEERMLELQRRKLALGEAVLGSDAAGTLKFSAEELELLLAPLGP